MKKIIVAAWIIIAVKLMPYIPESCYGAWVAAQRKLSRLHKSEL